MSSSVADAQSDFTSDLDATRLSRLKWEMEAQQRKRDDILDFGTADLDFKSPPAVIDALANVVRNGHFGYPHKTDGYYEALIGFYDRHFAWKIQRPWIASNVGIYPSMRPLVDELTREGDEVIFQSPVHFRFASLVTAAGRVAVANPLVLDSGRYQMDLDHLAASVTERTKLLFLCNPHNPVGRAWTQTELSRLSQFCIERNIIVVSDEVYCGLLFEGCKFTPYATVSRDAAMNSISLISASKMFNLMGLKHSQVVAENPAILAAYMRGLSRDTLDYGGSIFGHAGAEAAYREGDAWLGGLMKYVGQNFEFAFAFIKQFLAKARTTRPEAGYFLWLDLRDYGIADGDMRHLFEDGHRLIFTYGDKMGPGGEGHIRINLGTTRQLLEKGLLRLRGALGG